MDVSIKILPWLYSGHIDGRFHSYINFEPYKFASESSDKFYWFSGIIPSTLAQQFFSPTEKMLVWIVQNDLDIYSKILDCIFQEQ